MEKSTSKGRHVRARRVAKRLKRALTAPVKPRAKRPPGRPRITHKAGASRTQAQRIIDAFGGAYNLSRALMLVGKEEALRSVPSIYRWTYPVHKGGSAGLVPLNAMHWIKKAASLTNVTLTEEIVAPNVG